MAEKSPVFAANFKRLHRASGLTFQQIAEQVGVTLHAVNSWSKGVRIPGGENIARLAALFRCQPTEFFLALPEKRPPRPSPGR